MPGGVNSPVRSFRSVGGAPYFVERAEGPYVYDVEGRRYIDYVMSYGPGILGHAPVPVIEAIREAAGAGTSYGAPTEGEVLMAEELCTRVEGLEMVRLVSSGTEATMSAIRLARGAHVEPAMLTMSPSPAHTSSSTVAPSPGSGGSNACHVSPSQRSTSGSGPSSPTRYPTAQPCVGEITLMALRAPLPIAPSRCRCQPSPRRRAM